MVTTLLIQNKSLPVSVLFKGIGYAVTIPARAADFVCQIPTENALEDIQILLNNVPSLEVRILEDGEGIPVPPPVPEPPVLSYVGNYTPVVLKDEDYRGVWDASAGTAPHESPEAGWYWRVSVAGSTVLDGIDEWKKGDFIKWTGSLWMKAVGLAGYQSLFESLGDGDKLNIDWAPGNYTPEKVLESENTGQLAAHLKGIDNELGAIPDALKDYTHTDAEISAAISKTHDHSNKALLDSYRQTEVSIADAVAKKHGHQNAELLDTYTQPNDVIVDTVSKKHGHENLAALDQVTGVNSGDQDLTPYARTEDVNASFSAVATALSGKSDSDHVHATATSAENGFMSAADKSKMDGIEGSADVTDTDNVGAAIHGAAEKTTPVDDDEFPGIDSAASNVLKWFKWSSIKAAVKDYCDTLYNLYVHPTGDGNLHVPATGTDNSGKVLTAGASAGEISWEQPSGGGGNSFRNLIINGDMRFDQRRNGSAVTPTTSGDCYTLDKWKAIISLSSKISVQRVGATDFPGGAQNSLRVTTVSSYTPGVGDYSNIGTYIEGNNISNLYWGTVNAKPVTLSFWVKCSLTGTFSGSIRCSNNYYSYVFTYTINSANTWEYKTIVIPGPTTGAAQWLTTNGIGMNISFSMGVGTQYTTNTPNTWINADRSNATGSQAVVATGGATFSLTLVQLEPGQIATPFEFRPFQVEQILCMRYYQEYISDPYRAGAIISGYANAGSVQIVRSFLFPVKMRSYATTAVIVGTWGFTNTTSISMGTTSDSGMEIFCFSNAAGLVEAFPMNNGTGLTISADF